MIRPLTLFFVFSASNALADPSVIEHAAIDGTRISVTLSHPDTGWDHYADGWSVFAPDGTLLGTRVLAHPHVNEQPFTRSLRLDLLPAGIDHVTIIAKDNKGDESAPYRLNLEN